MEDLLFLCVNVYLRCMSFLLLFPNLSLGNNKEDRCELGRKLWWERVELLTRLVGACRRLGREGGSGVRAARAGRSG
jgi:hypothetical protein